MIAGAVRESPTTPTALREPLTWPWLQGPAFDLIWLIGLPALPALGLLAVAPGAVRDVIVVLGAPVVMPHIAASYSRLYATADDRRRWRWLGFAAPLGLLLAVLLVMGFAGATGVALLMAAYVGWVSWHYARQAWGIVRAYSRRRGADEAEARFLWWAVHVPMLVASAWWITRLQGYFGDLAFFPAPQSLPAWVLALGPIALAPAVIRAALDRESWRGHRLDVLTAVYTGVLFYVGFVAMPAPVDGFVVLGIWHATQYEAFVWATERRRAAVLPRAWAWCLPPRRFWAYLVALAATALLVFRGPSVLAGWVAGADAAAAAWLVVWFAGNFHHFLADTWIWRRAAPARAPAS